MAAPKPRRYAIAALQLALENEGIERWEQDLSRASEALSNEDFSSFLEAPQVPDEAKLRGIDTLLGDLSPLVKNMVSLLAVRGEIPSFPMVLTDFQDMANERRGIALAEVTTAVPLDDARRERLRRGLSELTGKRISLTEQVEPDIIGGIVAKVGDRLIDGSTRTKLRTMREGLAVRRLRPQEEEN